MFGQADAEEAAEKKDEQAADIFAESAPTEEEKAVEEAKKKSIEDVDDIFSM